MIKRALIATVIAITLIIGIIAVSASHDRDMEEQYETVNIRGIDYYGLKINNPDKEAAIDIKEKQAELIKELKEKEIVDSYDSDSYDSPDCYTVSQVRSDCEINIKNECQEINKEIKVPCYDELDQEKDNGRNYVPEQTKKHCRKKITDRCGNIIVDDECYDEPEQAKDDGKLNIPEQERYVPCYKILDEERGARACWN
ncbi:MAG: hypothetical protein Q8N99_03655 [Nanoarchaeota archaeon]|nr:hypothetical protein [Nanoarchaeota archaeon]